jgi:hypothetical protein
MGIKSAKRGLPNPDEIEDPISSALSSTWKVSKPQPEPNTV